MNKIDISINYLKKLTECNWSLSSSESLCIYTSSTSIQEIHIVSILNHNNIRYFRGSIYGLYVNIDEVFSKIRDEKINSILNEKS